MPLKEGAIVTARLGGKMLAREDGVPVVGKWVEWVKGSVGRVVGVRQITSGVRGLRGTAFLYLVKFQAGVVELRAMHLEGAGDDSEYIRKEVMTIVDPDVNSKETPIEEEPGY